MTFGVGTPGAAQGTALEKYHGADTGAVVEAEFLDIKEKGVHGLMIVVFVWIVNYFILIRNIFILINNILT